LFRLQLLVTVETKDQLDQQVLLVPMVLLVLRAQQGLLEPLERKVFKDLLGLKVFKASKVFKEKLVQQDLLEKLVLTDSLVPMELQDLREKLDLREMWDLRALQGQRVLTLL
jgi:hypothetical protein